MRTPPTVSTGRRIRPARFAAAMALRWMMSMPIWRSQCPRGCGRWCRRRASPMPPARRRAPTAAHAWPACSGITCGRNRKNDYGHWPCLRRECRTGGPIDELSSNVVFVRRESGGGLQDSGSEDSALDDERELMTLADPRSATNGPRRSLRTASGTICPRYPEALKSFGRSLNQPPGKRGDPTRDSAPARRSFRPAGVSKSSTRSASSIGRHPPSDTLQGRRTFKVTRASSPHVDRLVRLKRFELILLRM